MRAALVRPAFGLDNLVVDDVADPPPPARGEIALRMRAASLNFRDLLVVRGAYDPRFPLPLVPCSDGVGVVEAVGEEVAGVAVGDRVCPIFAQEWLAGEPSRAAFRTTLGGPRPGVLRERMVVPAASVVRAPAHLTDAEAATLPCAGVTAWNAVVELGRVQPGDVVLVEGTGGVSLFALQVAKLAGARVIVTSKSEAKLARARALGADEGIDYAREPAWGKAARALTGGRGVDLVVDVGGAGTLPEALRAVRHGGTIAVIGVLAGSAPPLDVLPILMGQIRLQGVFVGHRASFEAFARAIETAQLRPVVDAVLPLDRVREAFDHLAAGRHFGKIAIALAPGAEPPVTR